MRKQIVFALLLFHSICSFGQSVYLETNRLSTNDSIKLRLHFTEPVADFDPAKIVTSEEVDYGEVEYEFRLDTIFDYLKKCFTNESTCNCRLDTDNFHLRILSNFDYSSACTQNYYYDNEAGGGGCIEMYGETYVGFSFFSGRYTCILFENPSQIRLTYRSSENYLNLPSSEYYDIEFDQDKNLYLLEGGNTLKLYSAEFEYQGEIKLEEGGSNFDFDWEHNIYIANDERIVKLSKDGSKLGEFVNIRGDSKILDIDSDGVDLWVYHEWGFYRISNDLELLSSHELDFQSRAGYISAGLGKVYVMSPRGLRIYTEDLLIKALPQKEGTISFSIPSDAFHDYYGNAFTAKNDISVTYDTTPPNGEIFYPNNTQHSAPVKMELRFDEPIQEIDSSFFRIEPAVTQVEVVKKDLAYQVNIRPAKNGIHKMFLAKEIKDLAGNSYSSDGEQIQFNFELEYIPLSLASSHDESNLVDNIPFEINTESYIFSTNRSKVKAPNSKFAGGLRVTDSTQALSFMINPNNDFGTISVQILDSLAFDKFGNPTLGSEELTVTYQKVPLITSMLDTLDAFLTESNFDLQFNLSRPFVESDESRIIVQGGSIVKSKQEDGVYTLSIKTTEEAEVYVKLMDDALIDEYGMGNQQISLSYYVDTTPPEVTISTSQETINSTDPFEVSVFFDDPVFHFDIDPFTCLIFPDYCFNTTDLKVSGGEIVSFWASSDYQRFSFDVQPVNQVISIHVPENCTVNAFDMSNIGSDELQIVYKDGLLSNEGSNIQKPIEVVLTERNLEVKLKEVESVTLQVYDLQGRGVINEELNTNASYDLSSVSAGVYVIRLISEEGEYFQKVILK
ncbi:MAG: T9SS type A sorting domain-containing protein [Cyclobacteriaceae bacterium]